MESRNKISSILIAEDPQYRGLVNRVLWSRCLFELAISVAALSFFVYYFLAEKIFVVKFLSCHSVIHGFLCVTSIALSVGFIARFFYGHWREKKKRILLNACRTHYLSKKENQ